MIIDWFAIAFHNAFDIFLTRRKQIISVLFYYVFDELEKPFEVFKSTFDIYYFCFHLVKIWKLYIQRCKFYIPFILQIMKILLAMYITALIYFESQISKLSQ